MDNNEAIGHRFWSERQDPVWVKVLNVASTVAVFGILFVLVAWVIHAIFVANPPSSFDEPLLVDKAEYAPGDDIAITAVNFCRNTDAPAIAYITYYEVNSGKSYQVFSRPANAADKGCVEKLTIVEKVPLVPAGMYERRSKIVYDLGLLVKREVSFRTEPFEVLPIE